MLVCLGTTPTVQQTMIFERLVADEVNRAASVQRSSAGKAVNVARVLGTLGKPAMLCVPLGGDTGDFIAANLAAEGIEHDCVPAPNPTRTCVTVIDRHGGTVTELVEEHAAIGADVATALLDKLRSHLPKCKALVLSGTLAPGSGNDFYARCCALAAELNVPVILDAKAEPLLLALAARPLVVKPNRAELAATLGYELGTEAALRRAAGELAAKGAGWVVITMGKDGAFVSDGHQVWDIPAIAVKAISPIGSGDAFSAGLAAEVAAGKDVPEACLLGAACAAANTLIAGAGYLKLEDVNRLRTQAKLERR